MPQKIYIWSLNSSYNLLTDKELYLNNIFGLKGRDWDFGKRDYLGTITHNLMPDKEYFVPIAAKTLGRLMDYNNNTIKDIKDYYYKVWKQEETRKNYTDLYKSFWDLGCGPESLSKMYTDPNLYLGYYEILKNTGANNILIAYSQGGLTARFLAYLDEYIFNDNIIKAIITIQSPNFGSPLANPDNRADIICGIIEGFTSIFSMYSPKFNAFLDFLKAGIKFESLNEILINALEGIKSLQVSTDISAETKEKAIDFVTTIIKWLSGLNGCKDTAFYDLNISRLDNANESSSILPLVNNFPLNRIYYGAVISANNKLDDIISSFLKEFLAGIVKMMVQGSFKKVKFLDKSLQENFEHITELIKDKVYVEKNKNNYTNNLIKKILDIYDNGTNQNDATDLKLNCSLLQAKTHDFVIPSSFQLLLNNNNNNFLGNKINEIANHNSGKSCRFTAGWKNFEYIKQFLKEIKDKCSFD